MLAQSGGWRGCSGSWLAAWWSLVIWHVSDGWRVTLKDEVAEYGECTFDASNGEG